jgi:hypothetical protein
MTPTRLGRIKSLTLKEDAIAILESRAVGRNAQGRYLSFLLKQEEARIEERQHARQELERLKEQLVEAVEAELAYY